MAPARGASPSPRSSGKADQFDPPGVSDVQDMSRRARSRDQEHAQAYKHGYHRSAERGRYDGDSELQGSYDSGSENRRLDEEHFPLGRRHPDQPAGSVPAAADDGAGFILGVVAYVLVLNFIRGGMPAVRGWFAAKFLNKPYGGAALQPLTPAPPTGAGR